MTGPAIVAVEREVSASPERLFDAWADQADPVRSGWTMILQSLEREMEKDNG